MTVRMMFAFGIWLAVSLGGKAMRYGSPASDGEASAVAAIEGFLQGWDWKDTGQRTDSNHIIKFSKSGCAKPLIIAMLGTGAENVPVLRKKFGSDLIFFQNGTPVYFPSMWRGHLLYVKSAIARIWGGTKPPIHPIFGVSPEPSGQLPPCVAPSASEWSRFLSQSGI
jgi:hypothetical protein